MTDTPLTPPVPDSPLLSPEEENPTLPNKMLDEDLPTRSQNNPLSLAPENLSLQDTDVLMDPTKRYKIAETLGAGGMGVVQSAKDCLLGREVALKTIKTNLQKDQPISTMQKMMLWRLSREASIMAILEHPNIVPLYDMQQSVSGERSFTMRKIEGQTLHQILKKMYHQERPYEEDFLLSIFLKVCDAISYAHARGVIHRDLKPDNIMVGAFGEVYVLDWGIAKISQEADLDWLKEFSESTGKDLLSQDYHTIGGIGTPGYMSPEQSKGNTPLQPQSDIYALGRILRQCYVLLPPIEEIRRNMAHQQNKEKSSIRLVPKDIDAISQKATREDSNERYPTIQDFMEDIRRYRTQQQISARKYGLGELLVRWIHRYRKHLFLLSILLLLGMTSFGYFYQIHQKTQQLNRHQERLDYWFSRLSTGAIEEEERENAIFEISKMPEDEIFQQLLSKIQEGTEYFLRDDSRTMKQDEFYEILATVLGRMEKPFIAPVLMDFLKKLAARRIRFASVSDIDYMVALAQAIGRSKNASMAKPLQEIRIKMGQVSLFWNRTKIAYRMLLQQNPHSEKIADSLTASDILENAMSDLQQEHYSQAIDLFTHALKLDPTLVFGYSNRGLAKFFIKDLEGSIADFTQAIQLDPNCVEAYLNRAEVHIHKKEWNRAFSDQNKAIQIAPEMAWGYASRGISKSEFGDFQGALNDFSQAIALSPHAPDLYFNRGLTHERMKEPDLAMKDYDEAIRLNPGYYAAYNNRGFLKLLRKEFEGALYDFNKVIQINPQHANAYKNRGNTKRELGDLPGSVADLDVAIQLNPNSIDNYLDRQYSKSIKGDIHGAIADCHQILTLDPMNAWGYYYLGVAYLNLKNDEKKDIHFSKFLELSETTTDAKMNAARKFVQQKFPHLKK